MNELRERKFNQRHVQELEDFLRRVSTAARL